MPEGRLDKLLVGIRPGVVMKEMYFEIMKEWLGDSHSFMNLTKKQISFSSSSIDIGRRLSTINLDLY